MNYVSFLFDPDAWSGSNGVGKRKAYYEYFNSKSKPIGLIGLWHPYPGFSEIFELPHRVLFDYRWSHWVRID